MGVTKTEQLEQDELKREIRGKCRCGDPLSEEDEDGLCGACSRRKDKTEAE